MKKKYLMNGLAAMAVGLFAASCSKESALGNGDALKHAEEVLGVTIDPNQNWKMTQEVTTYITVNLGTGQDYTVYVYNKSPFDNDDAVYYTRRTVQDASIMQVDLSVPTNLETLYVSVYDSEGASVSKYVAIKDGVLLTVFGKAMAESYTFTRSQSSPEVKDIPAPYDADWVATYLETAKEPNSTNVNDNYDNSVYHEAVDSTWVVTKGSYYVQPTEKWVVDVEGHNETITTRKWVEGKDWGWDWNGNPAYAFAYQTGYDWFKWSNYDAADVTFWQTYCQPYMNQNWAFYDAENKKDATTRLIQLLRENNRGSWVNVWAEGSSGGYQDVTETKWIPEQGHKETIEGYWTEEEGYWTEPKEAYWEYDEDWVTNFKIIGKGDKAYTGFINVAASEGSSSPGSERTIVVTGTWNITVDGGTTQQKIGSLGKVIIADGGTINVGEGASLHFVNQARLVVLPGGKLTGSGKVEVNNGNAEGFENYNGGTIDVSEFNNNFGRFYNHGNFKVATYHGGAQESNFYNHALVSINQTGSSSNARVFNACQFYVKTNARLRNYEGVQGSALIVDGQLMFSGSADGTSDPTYVGLAAGALVQAGTLYNNGTSWTGPTAGGYAVLKIGQFDYMNWVQDHPEQGGYFINNIYLVADELTNVPTGNGYQQTDPTDAINHGFSTAYYKFTQIVANAGGNGNTKIVKSGEDEIIPADDNFEKGVSGCTPGIKIDIPDGDEQEEETNIEQEEVHESSDNKPVTPAIYSYAFEDSWMSDYDLNDVVIKVKQNEEDESKMDVILCCTGASYNLYAFIGETGDETSSTRLFGGKEVHAALAGTAGMFINTGSGGDKFDSKSPETFTMNIPTGYTLGSLPIWIKSPERNIGVAESGTDPHGVVIPMDWQWPREWTSVKVAYPNFINFAANQNNNTNWYEFPAKSGGVIDTSKIFTGQ